MIVYRVVSCISPHPLSPRVTPAQNHHPHTNLTPHPLRCSEMDEAREAIELLMAEMAEANGK